MWAPVQMAHIIFVVRRKVSAIRCETCGFHSATISPCRSSRTFCCLVESSRPVVAKTGRPFAAATAASAGFAKAVSFRVLKALGFGVSLEPAAFRHLLEGSCLDGAARFFDRSGALDSLSGLACEAGVLGLADGAAARALAFGAFSAFPGVSLPGAVARRLLIRVAKGASESSSLIPLRTSSILAATSESACRPCLPFFSKASGDGAVAGPGVRATGPPSSAGSGLCQCGGTLVFVLGLGFARLLAAVRLTSFGSSWLKLPGITLGPLNPLGLEPLSVASALAPVSTKAKWLRSAGALGALALAPFAENLGLPVLLTSRALSSS
mmetsp:Transcript_127081/g.301854  ORF Transcript_127081/g.301854 Transcript_127081/m.301854 type:complete len:324 (-) Transcript_127081:1448-2419(-)